MILEFALIWVVGLIILFTLVSTQPLDQKALALSSWQISLALGIMALLNYLLTYEISSPESAGEGFAYGLVFLFLFCLSFLLAIGSFINFTIFWRLSKDYTRVNRIKLTLPIGLILSPVLFQTLIIGYAVISIIAA